jgi:hypothetical protein
VNTWLNYPYKVVNSTTGECKTLQSGCNNTKLQSQTSRQFWRHLKYDFEPERTPRHCNDAHGKKIQAFTCIISGPTESWNSTFCIRFLQHLDSVYRAAFQSGHCLVLQWEDSCPHTRVSPSEEEHPLWRDRAPNFGNGTGDNRVSWFSTIFERSLFARVRLPFHGRHSTPQPQCDSNHPKSVSPRQALQRHFLGRQISGAIEERSGLEQVPLSGALSVSRGSRQSVKVVSGCYS